MRSYPVKKNHIGSAVSKIRRYTQTDIHTGGRGGWVVSYPKIIINLPRTYGKLQCKGETYRFSCKRDPSIQTDIHTDKDHVTLL